MNPPPATGPALMLSPSPLGGRSPTRSVNGPALPGANSTSRVMPSPSTANATGPRAPLSPTPTTVATLGVLSLVAPDRNPSSSRSTDTGPRRRLGLKVTSKPASPVKVKPDALDQVRPSVIGTTTVA